MGKKKSIYEWSDPVLQAHKKTEFVTANQPGHHWVVPIDESQKKPTPNMVKATPGAKNMLSNNYYTRLASLESGNKLDPVNQYGYIGRYQMGADALVDLGYLKKEAAGKGNKVMDDPSMWIGKNKILSKEDFLSNEKAQEAAVREYTDLNRARLTNNKIGDVNVIRAAEAVGINADALLGSSHLLGAEGMKNYVSDLYQLKNATTSDDYDINAVRGAYDRLLDYKDGNEKTAADRIKEFGGSIDIDFEKIQSIIPPEPRESLEKLPFIGAPMPAPGIEESLISRLPAGSLPQDPLKDYDIFVPKGGLGGKGGGTTGNDPIGKASKMAQVTNIANIGASVAGGLYSMWQVNKMKAPEPVTPEKVEAVRIGDRGAQLEASGRMSIDRGIATSRNALQRSGRTDLLPTVTAGETAATNQLSGSVEQMRLQIDQMNAASESRAREINASAKSQASLFNSQTLQSFQQMKSQLGTQAISTMGQNISANASAISSNAFGKAMYEDQSKRQEKSIYMSMLNSPDQTIRAQGMAALKKLNKG